ncbi:hypothetical protein WDU94_010923, partial [Cyamophila willieti]
ILQGKVNSLTCSYFYGASLCALLKRGGGLRPIAIGSTFRRLVSKVSCSYVKHSLSQYFLPNQYGFGVPQGCETIIHSIRSFLNKNLQTPKILLKIDFSNAFNSIERDTMLARIREKCPQLYSYLWQCYQSPSHLFYGDDILSSQVGSQQGDPTGPLAFSLTIHPLIMSLKSHINLWYLDDGTLCDSPDIVLEDFKTIISGARELGLEINSSKCEIFFCDDQLPVPLDVITSFQIIAPGIRIVEKDELEMLGSPIFEGGVEVFAKKKFEKINILIERLGQIHAHYAYFLLKNCLAIPKLTYFIRTTPLWKFTNLVNDIDTKVKQGLESILNIQLNDSQWAQASLPIANGGLGIHKVKNLALPAFLASSYGVQQLVSIIIESREYESDVSHLDEALTAWNIMIPSQQKPENVIHQREWFEISIKKVIEDLVFPSPLEKQRFNVLQNYVSGAWLRAIPSPNIGTFLDNNTMRVCVGIRLGCTICRTHTCSCGSTVDDTGRHGLSCKFSAGRISRHSEINKIVQRALSSANISARLEPNGLLREDGKRPDGITNIAWERGKFLVWDVTCVDSMAKSYLDCSLAPGYPGESAAKKKHLKYATIAQNHHFLAFAVETLGPWPDETINFIDRLGGLLYEASQEPRSRSFLVERISLSIQRGNSASVLGSLPPSSSFEEIFYL